MLPTTIPNISLLFYPLSTDLELMYTCELNAVFYFDGRYLFLTSNVIYHDPVDLYVFHLWTQLIL